MSTLQVFLDVPPAIVMGLSTGALERVGGVVRDPSNGQVVAWLRDTGLRQVQDPTSSITRLVMHASLAGTVINTALSTASLMIIHDRFNKLSSQIDQLAEDIRAQFDRYHRMEVEGALSDAEEAFQTEKESIREKRIDDAITRLKNAFRSERDYFKTHYKDRKLLAAHHSLLNQMYLLTARTRCHLQLEEIELAHNRFNDGFKEIRGFIKDMTDQWLGENRAVYFHKTFAAIDFRRFLNVHGWLTDQTDVLEIINEFREKFWDETLLPDHVTPFHEAIRGIERRSINDATKNRMLECLTHAEILMENYRRLEGYKLELAELRMAEMTFEGWRQQTGDENAAIIVDTERLARLQL